MRVLCVGGGSGGHVTPVLAVINELKQLDPDVEVMFVCDKAFEMQSRGLMEHASVPVTIKVVSAGKFRRYHGESLVKRLLDFPTIAKNIRDLALIILGFLQSLFLIARFKPDVVFAKGGYVCLPLGYAAKLLRKPLVIHDSDARPGLTNKLLARFASGIATGTPLENYSYPKEKSIYTGVPIAPEFHPFSEQEQRQAKHDIGIVDLDKPVVLVTGGGLGAGSINTGIVTIAEKLLGAGFAIYHITGKKNYDTVKNKAIEHPDNHIVDFVYKDQATVFGAADIVVSRGSATFLQELAALAKPTIIVPAAHLGDQVKNAAVYEAANAAFILDDSTVADGNALLEAIMAWRLDAKGSKAMAERFHSFAKPDAARSVAVLIASLGSSVEKGSDASR